MGKISRMNTTLTIAQDFQYPSGIEIPLGQHAHEQQFNLGQRQRGGFSSQPNFS